MQGALTQPPREDFVALAPFQAGSWNAMVRPLGQHAEQSTINTRRMLRAPQAAPQPFSGEHLAR